jgi:hypothetical protein
LRAVEERLPHRTWLPTTGRRVESFRWDFLGANWTTLLVLPPLLKMKTLGRRDENERD